MDNFQYQDKLEEWGLGSYFETFLEEGITDESFVLVDGETIKLIFKKCGPRLVFMKKFLEYKKMLKGQNIETDSNASTETVSNLSMSYSYEPEEELQAMFSSTPQSGDVFIVPSSVPMYKRCSPDIANQAAKKFKPASIFSDGLENLLRQCAEGRIILAHKNKLNNDLGQKLAKIIINELVTTDSQFDVETSMKAEIKASTFLQVAEEILKLFPSETMDTYYIPYMPQKPGSSKQAARGKLWSRYINVKAALRAANSCNPCNTSKSSSIVKDNDDLTRIEEGLDEQINFLKQAVEPYPKILENWEATFSKRIKNYKNESIDTIFDDFPSLKLQTGIELLESDFNLLYPDKIDLIYTQWPQISLAIIDEAKQRKISLAEETDIERSTQALLLLPLLFSPVTITKKKNTSNWRPTRAEVQESFFFSLQNYSQLEETISKRRENLKKYDVPLQPFAVVIGQINSVETFYIIINENKYKCNSSIRCLELLYKTFHALNLQYPAESKHVWLFIQEVVFQMNATSKNSSTATVIADIKYHLNQK